MFTYICHGVQYVLEKAYLSVFLLALLGPFLYSQETSHDNSPNLTASTDIRAKFMSEQKSWLALRGVNVPHYNEREMGNIPKHLISFTNSLDARTSTVFEDNLGLTRAIAQL